MLRMLLCSVAALAIFAGGLLAAEGTIVSADKQTGKIVIKVGDKEQTIEAKDVKILNPAGKEVKNIGALKEGRKVEVVEEGGKITELKLKKGK